jgi:hypothetical protein
MLIAESPERSMKTQKHLLGGILRIVTAAEHAQSYGINLPIVAAQDLLESLENVLLHQTRRECDLIHVTHINVAAAGNVEKYLVS